MIGKRNTRRLRRMMRSPQLLRKWHPYGMFCLSLPEKELVILQASAAEHHRVRDPDSGIAHEEDKRFQLFGGRGRYLRVDFADRIGSPEDLFHLLIGEWERRIIMDDRPIKILRGVRTLAGPRILCLVSSRSAPCCADLRR